MGTRQSHNNDDPEDVPPTPPGQWPYPQWPYLHRHALIQVIGAYVMTNQISQARKKLLELREFCGMSPTLDPDSNTCSDGELQDKPNAHTECLIEHLTSYIAPELDGWRDNFKKTIDELSRAIGPPKYESGAIPDVNEHCSELMMTGKELYTNSLELNKLHKFIGSSSAKHIVKFDLGFTGIDDTGLKYMLSRIARMPRLAYLGLQGNRLTTTTLDRLLEILGEENKFTSMKWMDLSNNKDIVTLPPAFMDYLRRRWETETYRPTFIELVHNKAIISTETGHFIHNI